MNPLDLAIQNTVRAESTLAADENNLESLKASAAAAAEPVPGAQSKVDEDVTNFDASLDRLAAAAIASKRRKVVPPPVPVEEVEIDTIAPASE